MSNNPFLRTKEQSKSNRFDFLDSEESNKNLSIKDKKHNYQYEISNNSFIKSSSSNKSSSFNKSSSNNSSSNNFSSNKSNIVYHKKEQNNHFRETTPIVKTGEFIINEELFPSLTPIVTSSKNNSTNFKDALNQKNEITIVNDISLKPGWVQISKVNDKIIINQAKPSPYDIKMKQIEELYKDTNYIMNQIVNTMQANWLKYKTNYDNINGEGSYDDLYYLPPVYDSDYDTDECESLSDDNIDDFEDLTWYDN